MRSRAAHQFCYIYNYLFGIAFILWGVSAYADSPKIEASNAQPIGSTGFNDMLGKQIKPGTMTVAEQADGSFLLTNKLQTVSAHVTCDRVHFDSIGNSEGKGSFRLTLNRWGHSDKLHAVRPVEIYKKDDVVYHIHTDGLVEKFSNTSGGIQQDFVIAEKPAGGGDLHIQLQVSDAAVKQKNNGAIIALNSGRQLTYDRLNVTDSVGKNIPAEILVIKKNTIDVVVHDTTAQYPLVIDPIVGDANWIAMNQLPGTYGTISAVVSDGTNVYVAGSLKIAGTVKVNNIAMWDGNQWSSVGSGLTGDISALIINLQGNLVAAGQFPAINGVSQNSVQIWDGSSWTALGSGISGPVYALGIDSKGTIYAGGMFVNVAGITVNNIVSWNGTAWQGLGNGLNSLTNSGIRVLSIAIDANDNVIAGGLFSNASGTPVSNVALWNGSSWSALGSGVDNYIYSMKFDSNGNLYVGGWFAHAGGNAAQNVAMWNGSSWQALGTGISCSVDAIGIDSNGMVYAGGEGDPSYWDGNSWTVMGPSSCIGETGINSIINDNNGNLYFAGAFNIIANVSIANNIAKWHNNNWAALGQGMGMPVTSLTMDVNGNIFVTTGGVGSKGAVFEWNGTGWTQLGALLFSSSPQTIITDTKGDVYVGGSFDMPGGINFIAMWDGSSWQSVGPLNSVGGTVEALAFDKNGLLYAAGDFSVIEGGVANHIAVWDGSSWQSLGTGTDGVIRTLAIDSNGNVYIGGSFTTAGGVNTGDLAVWNGTAWSLVGINNPVWGGVYSIAFDGSGNLYAAPYLGDLMKWDGSSWTTFPGLTNPQIQNIVTDSKGNLYLLGYFYINNQTYSLIMWDGNEWISLNSSVGPDGVLPYGHMIIDTHDDLYIGGNFIFPSKDLASPYIAKYSFDIDHDAVENYLDCYPSDPSLSSCSPGTYPTGSGFASAPPGTYALNGNLSQCPAGTYSNTVGGASIDVCIQVPTGSYSFAGSATYSTVPAGYYADNGVLVICPAGTYNPDTGGASSAVCITTPVGYYSGAGAISPIQCFPSSLGSYPGSTKSQDCFYDNNHNAFPDWLDNIYADEPNENLGSSVVLTDFNNDGVPDVLIGEPNAPYIYESAGNIVVIKKAGSIRSVSGVNGPPVNSFTGHSLNQHLGSAFVVIPDIDGDGIPDLVIGNPYADSSELINGKLVILKETGNVSIYSGKDLTIIKIIANGLSAHDKFGSSLAVGDVNGDSIPDIIVGAPFYDNSVSINGKSTVLKDIGQVTVFNGYTSMVLFKRSGSQAGEHFGSSVAVDSNLHQLIVGSPGFDNTISALGKTTKIVDAGRVQLFDGTDITGLSPALVSVSGLNKGDRFGAAVSSFNNDIDGDGYDDWAVGIPGFDVHTSINGQIKILKDAGRVEFFSGVNSIPLNAYLNGDTAGENFGMAVSTSADFDRDGRNDIAVGSPKFTVPASIGSAGVVLQHGGRVQVFGSRAIF